MKLRDLQQTLPLLGTFSALLLVSILCLWFVKADGTLGPIAPEATAAVVAK